MPSGLDCFARVAVVSIIDTLSRVDPRSRFLVNARRPGESASAESGAEPAGLTLLFEPTLRRAAISNLTAEE